MSLDILFLAWNRVEFTRAAFEALLANTNWSLVRDLVIIDDGSIDGTLAYLEDQRVRVPAGTRLINVRQRSPVGSMNRYLEDRPAPAPWFVKLDNDVCVPPGYLERLLALRDETPDVDLIGMEAGMTARPDALDWDGIYRFEPSSHIGGIGLMRTGCFARRQMFPRGRFGFTEFQWQHDLKRGWITPDLPVVLLDRMPCEPWRSLSRMYVQKGWQRDWPSWDPKWMQWAFDWMGDTGCSG